MCKVSVIMPVYNGEEFLQESIDSFLGQSLQDIELICVDDGSGDSSLLILQENASKDPRITVLTQHNAGAGSARNKGIEVACGEFIAFLDSDDLYPAADTLESMYKEAKKHNALICGGSLNKLNGDRIITDPSEFETEYTFNKDGFIEFKDYQFDYGYWRFIYRREFLLDNQIQFPDYLRQQDPPFFLKAMILADRFYALKRPTYVYRVSHKAIQWNERKVVDMFQSISDSLSLAANYNMHRLYCSLFSHINTWTFQSAVAATLTSPAVRAQVIQVLEQIDFHILTGQGVQAEFADIYQSLYKSKTTGALVSVIVPVYNVEQYLAKCLDSLLQQTMPLIDIICVNDGATDGSLEILREYALKDDRIQIVNKENGGLSSARNRGMDVARTNYIMFVDSDDWIEPTTIEEALSHMVHEVDVVSWGAEVVNEGLSPFNQGVFRAKQYHSIKIRGEHTITHNVIRDSTYTAWNKLLKRSIITKYDLRFTEGRLFEDNDFLIKYLVHCRKGYYIDAFLYHYIQRPNSIMEKVRACKSPKTIDHLYIFDSIYQHFVTYQIADKWKDLLTGRYVSHLSQAYKYAPNDKKQEIRERASQFAENYSDQYFTTDCVQKVRNRAYHQVKELNDYIVSLTSYPKRIDDVHTAVASLLQQSQRADQVILWLADSQFPGKEADLPLELLKLQEQGLSIRWCSDIKSYKKLLPTLKEYPHAVIITADDDAIYHKHWLRGLVEAYTNNPLVIHCYRAHKVMIDGVRIQPYATWKKCIVSKQDRSSYSNFFTGLGGVLYPPACFEGTHIFDEQLFMKLCPYGDDIWFWGNAVLNNVRIHVVQTGQPILSLIEGSQDVALWHDNVDNQRNDMQIQQFEEQFPALLRILSRDIEDESLYLRYMSATIDSKHMPATYQDTSSDAIVIAYNCIKNSYSFRIGRVITWAPRKIRGLVWCFRDHGFIYTLKRVIEHAGIDMGTPDYKKR